MPISVRRCELAEIVPLRRLYQQEMDCQIIHDSIHGRPGWTTEYILDLNRAAIGYGSVAIGGPWTGAHALYEFYVREDCRMHIFDLFAALLAACSATTIETQTNDPILPVMLHSFAENVRSESILFEDLFEPRLVLEKVEFRATEAKDKELLRSLDLDQSADWVLSRKGEIAGAGGVLYHYNRPYGDIYMEIAEPYRRRGLGAYLVQELKAVCRAGGSVPAARCNVANVASRRTLQKAGFVPCGNIVVGDLPERAHRPGRA
jgi:GNAT superfamily N-acetyltransferase